MTEETYEGIPRDKIPWDSKIDYQKCITCGKCVDFCHMKTFTTEEKNGAFPGVSTRLHWPLDDPASVSGSQEEQLAKFREVRDQIEAKVKSWLNERGITQAPD